MSSKIKINLNIPFMTLDGKPGKMNKNETMKLSKLAGPALGNGKTKNYLKHTDWALDLYKGLELLLDEPDKDELIEFIEINEGLNDLMRSQIVRKIKADAEKAKNSK